MILKAANFGKYTGDYDPKKSSVTSVVFGSEVPLLETELNEMQESFKKQGALLLGGLFKEGAILNRINFNYTSSTLQVMNTIMCINGLVMYARQCNHPCIDGESVYVGVREVKATKDTILHLDGYLQGESIKNHLVDSRFGFETSQRKVIEYDFFSNVNDNSFNYLKLGNIRNNVFELLAPVVDLTTNNVVISETEPTNSTIWVKPVQ